MFFALSLWAERTPVIFLPEAMNVSSEKFMTYSDALVRL